MAGKSTAAKAENKEAEAGNVDELQALSDALALREKDLEAMESERDSWKESHDELLKVNEELGLKIESQKAVIEGLKSTIEELNSALAEKDSEVAQKGGYPIIKHEKESYELRLKKFIHRSKGKSVEVDEEYLKKNPDVVAELIEKKSGALVKKGGK